MVMSIVGEAIAPPFMGHIADRRSLHIGFVVPLICFVFVALYGFIWAKLSSRDSSLGVVNASGSFKAQSWYHLAVRERDIMFSHLCIRELAVIALGVSAIASLHGQNPISPTVSQDPTVIDLRC